VTILERILARKREEVAALRLDPGESALRSAALRAAPTRGFARALREGPRPRVIAEFKRASPSKGSIRADAVPAQIARAYEQAGASALSVLTDRDFFQGCLDDLRSARSACRLPVLRKDFTIDALQIAEARAAGADAILLIVAALDDRGLHGLLGEARGLGLDVLVEVHDRAELERARAAGAELIGINNRDLRTFHTDLSVTRGLIPFAPGCTLVSESGLDEAAVLSELESLGVDAFLVGEALMRQPDPGKALRELRGVA
jgi:indole-3-glycerol phosphate synthase